MTVLGRDQRALGIVGDFLERQRFVEHERSRRLAHQRAHVRRNADRGAEIVAERADVRAFAAGDAQSRRSLPEPVDVLGSSTPSTSDRRS